MVFITERFRKLNSRFGFREFTRKEWRLLVALLFLQAADLVTTELIESGIELNPLAGLFLERGVLWLPKLLLPLLTAMLVAVIEKPSWNLNRLIGIAVFIYVGVVGWNTFQLVAAL